METISFALFLLCVILYMSGWSDVENEQWSGVDVENERAEWMCTISEEDTYLRVAKKYFYVSLFCIDIM